MYTESRLENVENYKLDIIKTFIHMYYTARLFEWN